MNKIYTILADRPKSDKTHLIYVVTFLNRKRCQFNTGISVLPDEFDTEKGRIKGRGKRTADANLIIESIHNRITDIFVKYRLKNKELDPIMLRTEFKNPSYGIDFLQFLDKAVEDRKSEVADNTYRHNKVIIGKLRTFKSEIAFSELTPDFLNQWQKHLKTFYKNDINTINANMKRLRVYINIAIDKGLMEENPFERFKMKKTTTEFVFLEKKELKQMWELYTKEEIPVNERKTLRWFLFMCFTGLRVSDMSSITHEDNLLENNLVFMPIKTKGIKRKMIRIKLTPKSLKLISDEGNKKGRIFKTYAEQTQRKYLKRIAERMKLNKHISTKTGRHTFASLFVEKTRDVAALQQILGHSSIITTMIYTHVTDDTIEKRMKEFGKLI